jgi:hypothetical protein
MVTGATAPLRGASLETVMAAAALQSRLDRKYLLPAKLLPGFVARLPEGIRALEIGGRRQFHYESVYFDTPDLLLYRHHLQGRRRRFKVRTRTYLDSGECMFEVKVKGHRGRTIKARMPYQAAERVRLTDAAVEFLDEVLREEYGRAAPADLVPSATVTYTRTTLVDVDTGSRPTLDVDLRCASGHVGVSSRGGILVETKSADGDSPADRALRDLGIRPVRMSKYSMAVAVLHTDVPANPLHRVLRHSFGTQPGAAWAR